MPDPIEPVFLFDERDHMSVLPDPALADEMLETADEYFVGFDGMARPVRAEGKPGHVRLVLQSEESMETELRRRVALYYYRHARIRGLQPPDRSDLAAYVQAVAEDEVDE